MSHLKTGKQPKQQKDIGFTRPTALSTSVTWKKAPTLLPSGVTLWHPTGGVVLSEKDYVEYYLVKKLGPAALKAVGISHKIATNSTRFYREKYEKEIKERKHHTYSTALKGNTHGLKDAPDTVVPKNELQSLLTTGYPVRQIAEKLNVSAWFVRQSIKYHGLSKSGKLPYRMVDTDIEYLKRLEQYAPGLLDCTSQFYDDPKAFYDKLYTVFSELMDLVWFVKEQATGHNRFREAGKLPKDHLCWSSNRHELMLSAALLAQDIPHVRQYMFYKRYMADFAFPDAKLLVEVDGEFHKNDKVTQVRDRKREKEARRLGYRVLRFTTRQVAKNLVETVEKIRSALGESNQSSQ